MTSTMRLKTKRALRSALSDPSVLLEFKAAVSEGHRELTVQNCAKALAPERGLHEAAAAKLSPQCFEQSAPGEAIKSLFNIRFEDDARHTPFTGFVDDVLDSSAGIEDLGAGEAAALTSRKGREAGCRTFEEQSGP